MNPKNDPIAGLRDRDPRYDALDAYAGEPAPLLNADRLASIMARGPLVTISSTVHPAADVLEQIAEDLEGRAHGMNSARDRAALNRNAVDLRAIAEVVQPIVRKSDLPQKIGAVIDDGDSYWTRFSQASLGPTWISAFGELIDNAAMLAKLRAGAKVVFDGWEAP